MGNNFVKFGFFLYKRGVIRGLNIFGADKEDPSPKKLGQDQKNSPKTNWPRPKSNRPRQKK